MSEHRSNEVTYTLGKSMKAALMLEDLRKQKECSLYPDCACHTQGGGETAESIHLDVAPFR